jgi:hypothetical protein
MGISSAKVAGREERVRRMTSRKRKIENVKTRKRDIPHLHVFSFSRLLVFILFPTPKRVLNFLKVV